MLDHTRLNASCTAGRQRTYRYACDCPIPAPLIIPVLGIPILAKLSVVHVLGSSGFHPDEDSRNCQTRSFATWTWSLLATPRTTTYPCSRKYCTIVGSLTSNRCEGVTSMVGSDISGCCLLVFSRYLMAFFLLLTNFRQYVPLRSRSSLNTVPSLVVRQVEPRFSTLISNADTANKMLGGIFPCFSIVSNVCKFLRTGNDENIVPVVYVDKVKFFSARPVLNSVVQVCVSVVQ